MFRSVLTEAGLFKDVKKRCKEEHCGHKSQSRNPEGGDWLLSARMFCFLLFHITFVLSFPITYYLRNKFQMHVIVCKKHYRKNLQLLLLHMLQNSAQSLVWLLLALRCSDHLLSANISFLF